MLIRGRTVETSPKLTPVTATTGCSGHLKTNSIEPFVVRKLWHRLIGKGCLLNSRTTLSQNLIVNRSNIQPLGFGISTITEALQLNKQVVHCIKSNYMCNAG